MKEEKMTAIILTHPAKAAEEVCHEEQLQIWAEEIVGRLSIEGYLRDDLSYDDSIDIHKSVADEIKSIVTCAFMHPEGLRTRSVAEPT
jgi:DNA-directed RNA polymerase specialized sigma54-like protein